MDAEIVSVKVKSVERLKKDIAEDLKQGYVFFLISMEANGRPLEVKKKMRLDKPEKMLNKFMTKVLGLAEENYKEVKYYVADKTPPDQLDVTLANKAAVEDKVLLMLEEVEQFMKSGKFEVLATDKVIL